MLSIPGWVLTEFKHTSFGRRTSRMELGSNEKWELLIFKRIFTVERSFMYNNEGGMCYAPVFRTRILEMVGWQAGGKDTRETQSSTCGALNYICDGRNRWFVRSGLPGSFDFSHRLYF